MHHIRLRSAGVGLMAILLSMPFAHAQENANINGTATDPSGALVRNASVKLVNTETGDSRTGVTNGSGIFNFSGLRIGHYTLTVSAPGFKVSSKSGIVLNVAQTLEADVVLEVGTAGQTVSAEAGPRQTQSETSTENTPLSASQDALLA